jgi:hypothetical protein
MYNKINNMDNFDLKKYLAEGKLNESMIEKEELIKFAQFLDEDGLLGNDYILYKIDEYLKINKK